MPLLRKCKCGKKAYDEEDLELFVKSKVCNYGRRNKCKECGAKATRKSLGYLEPKKSAPKGTYTTGKGQAIYRRYGLSEKQHKELLDDKNNQCQICGVNEDLVVDHCHETKKVRGVLCKKCNIGIGNLNDSEQLIYKALMYLKDKEYLNREATCK